MEELIDAVRDGIEVCWAGLRACVQYASSLLLALCLCVSRTHTRTLSPRARPQFSLENVNKANCVASQQRLEWLNQQHVKRLAETELDRLSTLVLDHVQAGVDALADKTGQASVPVSNADGSPSELLRHAVHLQHVRWKCR